MWRAEMRVTLKPGVLDPQGRAVRQKLANLGWTGVSDVRVGKFLELLLEAPDRAAAAALVEEMGRRLLANPVLEDFSFDLEER
ncbi:MAG: phosphoribosylformylglycinamidine synthase subunit PurS [Thermaerobacter sp.]|nr:phosphoribosylformylglycinamidine synthase subunit PurS [Thermaerobacter sp.]